MRFQFRVDRAAGTMGDHGKARRDKSLLLLLRALISSLLAIDPAPAIFSSPCQGIAL
jgi:hypothetical protein